MESRPTTARGLGRTAAVVVSTALLCGCVASGNQADGGSGSGSEGEAAASTATSIRPLPDDRRGVTALVVCRDTVDPDRQHGSVLDALARAVPTGDEVVVRVGGPTVTDFDTFVVSGGEPRRPADSAGRRFELFLERIVRALPERVRELLDHLVTTTGFDVSDLVSGSVRWAADYAGGRPVRLLFFCTGLQRSTRGDLSTGPVDVPTLTAAAPSNIEAIRFVGVADFNGVQDDVEEAFRQRVLAYTEGLCAQLEHCKVLSTFAAHIDDEVWS